MKKLLAGSLVFFGILLGGIETTMAESKYTNVKVSTETRIDVYDNIDGVKTKVGVLLEGEEFRRTSVDDKYFYIKFGNGSAYYNHTDGKVSFVDGGNLEGENTNGTPSNTVVIPTKQINVYKHTNSNEVFAKINQGVRYPVIGKINDNWYRIDLGNRNGYIKASEVKVDKGIPVITYHHIAEKLTGINANNSAVITKQSFNSQMKYLHDNGYKTITINTFDRYLQKRTNLMDKTVLITFDDGNVSTVNDAYPVMKDYGFKATSFVIAGRIGEEAPPYNPEVFQFVGLKEMNETSDVFQYQHHTTNMHTTENGKPLMQVWGYSAIVNDTRMGAERIAMIDEYNGDTSKVKYMAYPFGATSEASRRALQDAGITMGFTTVLGNVNLGDDRMMLNRQIITPKDTITSFKQKIGE